MISCHLPHLDRYRFCTYVWVDDFCKKGCCVKTCIHDFFMYIYTYIMRLIDILDVNVISNNIHIRFELLFVSISFI